MAQTQSSSTATSGNALSAVFSTFIRLVILGYAALAVFCFFEIRALLLKSKSETSFEIDDGTLFVPLILCFPSRLQVGDLIIMDTINSTSPAYVENGAECRELDYLMSACAASLLFAAAGCSLFVFCDCLARFPCCPFDMYSSSGMAIFLTFVLGQAGIAIGALAEQNHYWVEYFKEIVDERNLDLDVESHAHVILLIGCSLSSFAVALLVLVDSTCSRCCQSQAAATRRREEEEKQERGIMGWIRQAREIEDASGQSLGGKKGTGSNSNEKHDAEQECTSTLAPSSGRSYAISPPWSQV